MEVELHFRSLTSEFESLKNRVRNFIAAQHWLTDGEWKESALRSVLSRYLPDVVRVGRGFVLHREGVTTQCDILIYKASSPILFRDGDLVFLTPDAVVGVIEVKSKATTAVLSEALQKFSDIGANLGADRSHCFFGLFAYETNIPDEVRVLKLLRENCRVDGSIVDFLSLGPSTFVRWWRSSPGGSQHYLKWHAYRLKNMAPGYFIANVVQRMSPESVQRNDWLWFPEHGKESKKIAEIDFTGSILLGAIEDRSESQDD